MLVFRYRRETTKKNYNILRSLVFGAHGGFETTKKNYNQLYGRPDPESGRVRNNQEELQRGVEPRHAYATLYAETTKKNYNFEYLVAPYGKSGEVLAEDTWL